MTNEDAITYADCLKNNYTINFDDMADFCDIAIKVLKQEDILNKVRAEILKLDDINPDYPMDRTIHISRNEVLQIIDKYKTESEG